MRARASLAALALALACAPLLMGCRPEPGMPVYVDDAMPIVPRLYVGAFYSGPASDSILIDDSTHRLDVFSGTISSITADNRDRTDGQPSWQLVHAGMGFWGLGIDWDVASDLSRWKTMHVSFKSSAASFAAFKITMNSGKAVDVDATAYGYKADGSWHVLAIPLADFIAKGFDPVMTRAPFVIGGGAGTAGDTLKVAGLYFDENQP